MDCRSKGWIGQAIYEYPTRKQALEQARKIAEAVRARGVDTTSTAIVFQDSGELSEYNTQLARQRRDTEAKRSQSLRIPELLEQWNRFKQDPSQQLRPRSQQSIQWWSQRFSKEFRKLRVTDLSYERLRKHYDNLKDTRARPASPRYRKQFLGYLGQFFNWCIQNGHTTSNPTVRFKVRSTVPDAEFLNLKQCRRLVEVLNLSEFKPIRSSVVVGLFAGIRQAELGRMTWADVNTDQNAIAVTRNNSKIRRGRSVPIEPTGQVCGVSRG
ncbi:MAG: tyrosine-type recombinase/integrase [Verrucomicrobiota bacterium]